MHYKKISEIVKEITASYASSHIINKLCCDNLPLRNDVLKILTLLRTLVFPSFYSHNQGERVHTKRLLYRLHCALRKTITQCLIFKNRKDIQTGGYSTGKRALQEKKASELSLLILSAVPAIRDIIDTDIEACYQGDPAAQSREEVLLSYPVVDALLSYRFAHELWLLDVPLLPRMMCECMHSITGIDIHPGARIDESFCIDHATGVVIGETTVIGKHVKLYQGVTLGALSVESRNIPGKRHPSIEDNVTIYSGATILGGETVIGHSSIIGGNVWITSSVPPYSKVYYKPNS